MKRLVISAIALVGLFFAVTLISNLPEQFEVTPMFARQPSLQPLAIQVRLA
jgi:hypothetical protein